MVYVHRGEQQSWQKLLKQRARARYSQEAECVHWIPWDRQRLNDKNFRMSFLRARIYVKNFMDNILCMLNTSWRESGTTVTHKVIILFKIDFKVESVFQSQLTNFILSYGICINNYSKIFIKYLICKERNTIYAHYLCRKWYNYAIILSLWKQYL